MDIDVVDNGNGSFSIFYTVKDAGEYTLNIKFGGQPVPGGFYTFTVSAIFSLMSLFSLCYLRFLCQFRKNQCS